jgi:hypothetical protein
LSFQSIISELNDNQRERRKYDFLCVAGPFIGNFVAWSLITFLPVHPFILFALAISSGVLMI